MSYVQGFIAPAPSREAYLDVARAAAPVFRENGATRVVECWEEDVPEGKLTSFPLAVKRAPGEAVVFSWIEWPNRATCDAAMPKVMEDPRIDQSQAAAAFDGKRMIWGGFAPILDEGGGRGRFVDGFVIAAPEANRAAYLELARLASRSFLAEGALRVVECWGEDVPDGKLTSFPMAVKLAPGEAALFSWIEWPDRATRDAATPKVMADPALVATQDRKVFDGARMIWGGFETILDA